MQSQGGGGGGPESRYTAMSYAAHSDGVDLYGHGPDAYTVLQHQHHIGHGPPGLSPTGHHHSLGLGSPSVHHHHGGKRSAESAGLNLKQDPMVGDVTMSSIGMGHNTMEEGPGGVPGTVGGQNGGSQSGITKKTPPPNGKKTKGRVKIKMEFIDNKLRRYTTFSKRKTGIMKKAYELSTLTGTQVMLLVASETGHVYTFATRKLQPMITSEAGKALIQTCLNSPDPPSSSVDQRMSATGFEETELTYTLHDEDQKDSDSDDEGEGDEAGGSSDAAGGSRSPSPVERSYSSDEDPSPKPPVTRAANKGSGRNSGSTETINGSGSRTNNNSILAGSSSANIPVNLTTNQLANISGLSGLSLTLPRGTNLASLLASASDLSSLLAGATVVAAAAAAASSASSGGSTDCLPASCPSSASRKNLPRLISLAHLGATASQQQPTSNNISAKDATPAPSGCSSTVLSQHQRGLCSDAKRDCPPLNLQTSRNMRDKKGNAKSRSAGGGGGGKKTKK